MTQLKKFAKTGLALAGAAAVSPLSALAQATNANIINLAPPTGSTFATTGNWTISRLAAAGVNLILAVAGLVAFFFLLYGGLQWILAGGDKEGTQKAQKRITAALIGLVIIFSTYAIIYLAGAFLGVSLTNFTISNV